MKKLDANLDLDSFFRSLRDSSGRALMLDYDGTLAPFVVRRDLAFPYPGVRGAVDAIMAMDACRLIVVSGRSVADLLPLMGFARSPEVWGSHGWERLYPDGRVELAELPAAQKEGLASAAEWAESSGYEERVEKKPASIAFHVRGLPDETATRLSSEAGSAFGNIAEESGLVVRGFDGGVELRAPGRDKGVAVKTVLSEMGEGGVAAYLGDDDTDEDAFRAIAGRGMGVLVRPEPRESAAGLWLKPPDELIWFLERWATECGGS